MSTHQKNAIVIGSGVAGIASAIRLAVQGFDVGVYEKNAAPGGKLTAFSKDGFHFDAGPSLFTQPRNIEDLFELAGEPMEDYFSYKPLPVACKYFYEGGKQVTGFANAEQFAKELAEKNGEQAVHVRSYLNRSAKLYNKIGDVFLEHSLHKKRTWLHKRVLKALPAVRFPYLFSTLGKYNSKKFNSPDTHKIFNRFATYNGSSPYKAPAMLSLIPHLEHNEGVFYPEGGMVSITNALYKLALKKGVKFHFSSPVEKIISNENKASGIVAGGINIKADVVVTNSDVYFTYKHLLGHEQKAKKILKRERSSSAFVFYWGMNKKFDDLDLHNIFFADDYKKEFETIFKSKTLHSDPTVYVNITSKIEKDKAPAGAENWFVMINMPATTAYNDEPLIKAVRKSIIDKLSRITGEDIEQYISSEEILHPKLIEQNTGSYLGSLYGTSSNSKMAAFFRHPNFTSYVKNLYFCGGSVHPGGGIPLCLKSARIATDIIAKDFKKSRH
jgi:phytoene desaturase